MDTTTIIIVLAIILLILIALNHIKVNQSNDTTSETASCSQTTYGCCPDGINSKINYYGTNCPSYQPGPGYSPTPLIPPTPLIGGCAGTRYGCCPDNITPKIDPQGSNCIVK